MWWSWICVVALLLGIILFFCFTRPVSSLRPCLDYVLTKCLGNVTVVVSSFVRLLRRRLDSNPRAQCLGSVVALIWWRRGITAWHTLVSCALVSSFPKFQWWEKKLDPNLVPVPLLLPCITNPSQIVLRPVSPLSCICLYRPVPSLTLANPTLLQLLPLLLLCLPFSGSVF